MLNHRRTLAAGTLAVFLAACGGDSAATLTLGASPAESRSANAETAMAGSKLAVWAPMVTYVAGDGLSDPRWTEGVGKQRAWKYTAPSSPGKELARIASALGVPGTVREDPANKGFWSTETMPGSPSFSSWGDVHGRWWSYSGSVVAPGAGSSSEPCPPDSKDCGSRPVDTIAPAVNLPTKNAAREKGLALLAKLGVDTSSEALSVNVLADDWSVSVHATALHDGEMSWARSWYVGYGSNSRLTDASGSMVTLEQADSYPVIDPVAAVKRLNEGLGLTGVTGWGAASREIAVDSAAPASDTPGGEPPAPVEIALVSARISYVDWSLADGTQMLLPAWALADADGNEVKVVAVADKYISRPQVDPAPEPAPEPSVVTVPGSSGSGSSGGGSSGSSGDVDVPAALIRDENAQKLVGLGEDEATKVATGNGWTVRVAERDGESFMLTADYRTDRVNLKVKNGRVTAVTVG
ncbi:MAG: hypothetical protein ACKO1X_07790 [Acidimicrobiales bacterium]